MRAWSAIDERVLLVRLALASVGGRSLVYGEAGDVDHRLFVAEQEADEQGGTAVIDVHRPQRVLGEREDVRDQLQQDRLVVEDPAGKEAFAPLVDHHAVVVFLADVHSGPDLGQVTSASSSSHTDPADDLADVVLHSDRVAYPH